MSGIYPFWERYRVVEWQHTAAGICTFFVMWFRAGGRKRRLTFPK